MVDINYLAGQASLWVQPNGPNTKPEYLGCHGTGDIEEPQGDVTLLYCPDPAQSGKFVVKNSFQGAPGAVTASIETDIRKVADYLESVKCPIPIFVHKVSCGRRDDFTNYDRSFVLRGARITTRTLSNLAARNPDNEDESLQTFEFAAQELLRVFTLSANRVTTVQATNITGLAIGGEERCEGDCGDVQSYGDIIAMSTASGAYLAPANVLVTQTGGTPAATAADPFAGGVDIRGVAVFKVGKNTTRILVGAGTTGASLTVAYTDDFGASWSTVAIQAGADFVANSNALFALDARNIWLGTNIGNVWYSEDGGVNWTLQTAAALDISGVAAISFFDSSYGYAAAVDGSIYKTVDGGAAWATATASGTAGSNTDIHAISRYFVYVAASDGMYYTHDGGTTFTKRNAYAIAAIDFRNELEGLAVGSAASANIYQTIDGGYTWSALALLANSGYTGVEWVSSSLAWATGAVNAGTALIAQLTPAP